MDISKLLFRISLSILNALSLLILLQVVFQAVPYFECDWPADKITRVNDMAKDFSITVISSTIFYLLLVIIPERIKRRQIRNNTINTINLLANIMQEIIAYLALRDSIKHNDPHYLDLDVNSLDKITHFDKKRSTNLYYSKYKNEIRTLTNVGNWDEVSFLSLRTNSVQQVASSYLDIPIIIYEDPELVFLIRQIRNCAFISNIRMICDNSLSIHISTLNESVKEFYEFYRSLCQYATDMSELYVGDKDASKVKSFPLKCYKE